MKKQLSLFVFFALLGLQIQAQDLIIPASGEKIECRIQQIREIGRASCRERVYTKV